MSNPIEQGKKLAAYQAVDEYITADHKVVGIGSGSTVVYVVERILQKPELKHIIYVPTSFQSKLLILEGGLTLGSVEQYPEIDVTIDGADEVDEDLNAIKGGGACQFQEKLVAEAAKKFVIVAGKEFIVKGMSIGSNWHTLDQLVFYRLQKEEQEAWYRMGQGRSYWSCSHDIQICHEIYRYQTLIEAYFFQAPYGKYALMWIA